MGNYQLNPSHKNDDYLKKYIQ